jgi:hypothetical protein
MIAFDRLQLAFSTGESFRALDGLALLLVVVMPIVRLRGVLELLSRERSANARDRAQQDVLDVSKSA